MIKVNAYAAPVWCSLISLWLHDNFIFLSSACVFNEFDIHWEYDRWDLCYLKHWRCQNLWNIWCCWGFFFQRPLVEYFALVTFYFVPNTYWPPISVPLLFISYMSLQVCFVIRTGKCDRLYDIINVAVVKILRFVELHVSVMYAYFT